MKNKKGLFLSALIGIFIIGVSIPLFMTNSKKVKADTITDLTNTTWVLNEPISWKFPTSGYSFGQFNGNVENYNINFTSNSINYTVMRWADSDTQYASAGRGGLLYGNTMVYDIDLDVFYNQAYRTIQITGGSSATNSYLISWFLNNATPYNPTPPGTQITHKYWSPYGIIQMTDDEVIGDNDIQYTVLFNEFTSSYDETTQTGLIFKGVLTEQDPAWSYIESINGSGINILYHGTTNNINNSMWLEFTYGDYIDSDLYDFMDLWGYWFDDGDAYIVGMNQGYVEGKQAGRALGQADGVEYSNLITRIFNGLGNILSIQIFPNITIGLLIGLPLLLGVFVIIIKILRG